jgi:hypothetical protein
MDGTDAVEFMEAFSKEFNVDMSEFEFDKHFGPEGFSPLDLFDIVYCWLGRIFKTRPIRGYCDHPQRLGICC